MLEHGIEPEDIESITVSKSDIAVTVVATPIEGKRAPEEYPKTMKHFMEVI